MKASERGHAARDAGGFRGRRVEWAVTALFIQRLNSLRGEAEKCQRGEDDYERYRSPFLPPKGKKTLRLLLYASALPEACSHGRETGGEILGGGGEGWREDALSPSFISSSHLYRQLFFCWQCVCFTAIQIMLTQGACLWTIRTTVARRLSVLVSYKKYSAGSKNGCLEISNKKNGKIVNLQKKGTIKIQVTFQCCL